MATPPTRLLNFISEQQLEEVKEKRGPRVEDGSVAVERPLYEILKDNKDKQQAEFNERFKHRPPKALDEDETEFLDKLEMYQKEQEKQLADEEARQLLNFQAAVASRTISAESKTSQPTPERQKPEVKEKRPAQTKSLTSLIRIKPQLKKPKIEEKTDSVLEDNEKDTCSSLDEMPSLPIEGGKEKMTQDQERTENSVGLQGLLSYADGSDEDD